MNSVKAETEEIFRTATKARVQRMNPEEFAAWCEVGEALDAVNYRKGRATLTVRGHTLYNLSAGRRGPGRMVWTDWKDRERKGIDVAYNVMLDPDATLTVWDEGTNTEIGVPLPHRGLLAD